MTKAHVSNYKSRLGARDATKSAVAIQPEPAPEPEPEPEPAGSSMNKSEAARAAVDAGYDKPAEAVEYIQREFGIEMNPTHFSAIKSNYKKAQAATAPAKGKPGRKPREAAPLVEGYVAPPEKPKTAGEPDMLLALESVKGLVDTYGADKVRRIVDLLS